MLTPADAAGRGRLQRVQAVVPSEVLGTQAFNPVGFLDEVFDAFEELDSVILGFAEQGADNPATAARGQAVVPESVIADPAALARAIEHAGTTIINFGDVAGESGSFQRLLQIYGREGEPCLRCGHPVRRITVGSRSTHLCTRCQRQR